METEFRGDYNIMRKNTQDFATSLLDHARTSNELEIMLNFNPTGENWEPGEKQNLERLKLAIKYKQKQVCCGWRMMETVETKCCGWWGN